MHVAPNLGELLWLLDGIDNCHVAADTFDTVENYTDDRKFRERFGGGAKQPSKEIINKASAAIRSRHEILNLELERALNTHKTYAAASRAGDKWRPFTSSEPSPGWLAVVEYRKVGMTAVRAISAPIGLRNWEKKEIVFVNRRLLTIEA